MENTQQPSTINHTYNNTGTQIINHHYAPYRTIISSDGQLHSFGTRESYQEYLDERKEQH